MPSNGSPTSNHARKTDIRNVNIPLVLAIGAGFTLAVVLVSAVVFVMGMSGTQAETSAQLTAAVQEQTRLGGELKEMSDAYGLRLSEVERCCSTTAVTLQNHLAVHPDVQLREMIQSMDEHMRAEIIRIYERIERITGL